MSLAEDAARSLNDPDEGWEPAMATALVSIAVSLEQLVQIRTYELTEFGGFDPEELFAHHSRPVVDTGPLPGGTDE